MANWKAHKYASITILAVVAGLLFNLGGVVGIDSMSEKAFNLIPWATLSGLGLLYVIWAFNSLIRA